LKASAPGSVVWLMLPDLDTPGMDALLPLYRDISKAFGCQLVICGQEKEPA